MAFLEWRKFNFFEIKKEVDNGRIAETLNGSTLTAFSSGNGQLVLCDSIGNIHLIPRSWRVNTFKAYETCVSLAFQLCQSPLLITAGEDEPGNLLIKVWDTNDIGKNNVPKCVRIFTVPTTTVLGARPAAAVSLCAHHNLVAVGLSDGTVWLRRGDLTRERGSRQKTMRDVNAPITGLAIKTTSKQTYLFVATLQNVFLYNITTKDKEHKVSLDNIGCAQRCSVLAETVQDSNFMIGRDDAVYCYTPDGRGPCYAVEGEKVMLQWFRSYLVIVAKVKSQPTGHLVTVLDIQNKFIVFSAPFSGIKAVLSEWGGFYLLGGNNEVYHLDEKDLQSKLSLLFKKNLYDVSIRIAKSQQYDSDSLIDIFRQYGDHLYAKGDHAAAVEQYIKTIGKLEASYVIRKFLESQHIDKLTMYLQALHKLGHATEDHTTLLLNCYTKLNHTDKLKEFILNKDRDLDFDIEIAIKVCRQASSEDALLLAKRYNKHDWYLKIQMEDHKKFADAVDYIGNLKFADAEYFMKKYGKVLIDKTPLESTAFLKKLCTDYKPANQPLVSERALDWTPTTVDKCSPDDFIHLFLNNSERLVEFLEYLVSDSCKYSMLVYDTLIEHYLRLWSSGYDKVNIEVKALKLLQNTEACYNKNQALVICQMYGFSPGVLYLYEESKLYQQILRYQMRIGDLQAALACCRRYGHQDPTLWVQALWYCAHDTTPHNATDVNSTTLQCILPEILSVIAKERLLAPLQVLDALCNSSTITLGDAQEYLNEVLNNEIKLTEREYESIEKYRSETQRLRAQISQLRDGPTTFQSSRCAACHHQLELPAVHFMCQHSYHQHCFQSFSENESDCPACQPANKQLLEMIKAQQTSRDIHETFHSQLERVDDAFSLVAEYFGRNVFNKVTVLTEQQNFVNRNVNPEPSSDDNYDLISKPKIIDKNVPTYGPGAEARIRLTEGQKQVLIAEPQKPNHRTQKQQQSSNIIPTPEGRMRLEERHRYEIPQGSSLSEAKLPRMFDTKRATLSSSVISGNNLNDKNGLHKFGDDKNPFNEDDDYDDSKNPFSDVYPDDKNPFKTDDDFDKNSNCFD